jgi:hypothetical protein
MFEKIVELSGLLQLEVKHLLHGLVNFFNLETWMIFIYYNVQLTHRIKKLKFKK